jgi:hypothetical protein
MWVDQENPMQPRVIQSLLRPLQVSAGLLIAAISSPNGK